MLISMKRVAAFAGAYSSRYTAVRIPIGKASTLTMTARSAVPTMPCPTPASIRAAREGRREDIRAALGEDRQAPLELVAHEHGEDGQGEQQGEQQERREDVARRRRRRLPLQGSSDGGRATDVAGRHGRLVALPRATHEHVAEQVERRA